MPTYAQPAINTPPPLMDPFAAFTEQFTPKRAVSYLRVSTREQAERGGREEGFSIPAQREANKKKAQSMGAMVAKEFVERGVSGTSTKRPALQEMLRYLEEEAATIDYVIVHKLDRLARNRADEVTLTTRFTELGIRLVSTSENIDQTPGGMLLQGIMSSIAEFYSRNLANEVLKGLNEKVQSGGTISRAPIGYLNTRDFSSGQEVRTVTVDETRAPLVTWAFKQYATGKWTLRTLVEELTARGLTTVPTPRLSSAPIQIRHLHSLLTNNYYIGVVTFKGVEYPGKHEPLIDKETFTQVQAILKGKVNGERTIKHEHYLKSTLYCGSCGFRMLVQVVKNRHGETYPYYSCLGRHSKRTGCKLPAVQIEKVERQIEEIYDRLSLAPSYRADLERFLHEEMANLRSDTIEERKQLESVKLDIERRQRKLLEAHYNDAIPIEMMRVEQKKLDAEHSDITRQLDRLNASFSDADIVIAQTLDIAQYIGQSYRQAPDNIRRMFNQLIFEKIMVITDEHQEHHLEVTLNEPFDLIFSPATRQAVAEASLAASRNTNKPTVSGGLSAQLDVAEASITRQSTQGLEHTGEEKRGISASHTPVVLVKGFSNNTLVDLRGIEPLTFSLRTRRATNCATDPEA